VVLSVDGEGLTGETVKEAINVSVLFPSGCCRSDLNFVQMHR
jgi:hypothetical protein